MKDTIAILTGMILCCVMGSDALVLQNYCNDKKEITKNEGGKFDEDLLFLGYGLNFTGETEDLLFFGKNLTCPGKTKLGLIAIGETIEFSGDNGNGVIAAGKDIVINGKVTGNNYIAGQTIRIDPDAEIKGTTFAGCERIIINGKIDGDLYIGARELQINNEIAGTVKFRGRTVVFGDKGKIKGNLHYRTKQQLSEKDSSKISGNVVYDQRDRTVMKEWKESARGAGMAFKIIMFVSFVSISCLFLFIPVFRKLDGKQDSDAFWKTALWGLIPVLCYPVVIIVCFALVITIPLAFILLLAWVPLFFVAYIIGATLTGKYLVSQLNWKIDKRHYQFLIGSFVFFVLSFIPVINVISFIFVITLGWGVYMAFLGDKTRTEEQQNS